MPRRIAYVPPWRPVPLRAVLRPLAVAAVAISLAACAAKRPVLYPNAQLRDDGMAAAEIEVDRCIAWADEWVGHRRTRAVTRETAEASVGGAATGAAVGAVVGSAGRGAAAGAAGGAARGVVRGLFRSRDPDPVNRRFVERCLHEQGYETVGWR